MLYYLHKKEKNMDNETKQVEDVNDYCAHFGIEVEFDMIANLDIEDQLVTELEVAFHEAFKIWKEKAEQKSAFISNVVWN